MMEKETDKEKIVERPAESAVDDKNDNCESSKDAKQQTKKCKTKKGDREEELNQQIGELKDQYMRLAAEFDNFRRRTAKERLDLIDSAGKDVLVGFLPVMDDCQRALQVLKSSDASQAAVEGTELILNKLDGFLKQKGIERIDAKGKEFDTDFHEAVAQFPVDDPEMKNKVYDVTQEGYTLNGNVVRYAKVVVGV